MDVRMHPDTSMVGSGIAESVPIVFLIAPTKNSQAEETSSITSCKGASL